MSNDPGEFGVFEIGLVDSSTPESDRQPNGKPDRSGQRNSLALTVLAIALAVAAFVALPTLLAGGDEEDQASDGPTPAPASVANPGDGARSSTDAAAVVPGFSPPSASHIREDEVGLLFSGELDRDDVRYGIAYVADGEFIVLDGRGITVPELEIAQDFATVSNQALLTNAGRTWAIDTADRDRSFLVSNTYVVVGSERPGTIAVIDPLNLSSIGLMSSSLPAPSVALPEGAELLWVQGRGVLVLPRTGATFEVAGTATSLTRINDARAIAASVNATVYERCDDLLECSYFVVAPMIADEEFELPFPEGTAFAPSPDGRFVVAVDGANVTLVEAGVSQDTVTASTAVAPVAVAWAPDSSFVAIVRDDRVQIVLADRSQIFEVQLNHAPDEDSLLVFAAD